MRGREKGRRKRSFLFRSWKRKKSTARAISISFPFSCDFVPFAAHVCHVTRGSGVSVVFGRKRRSYQAMERKKETNRQQFRRDCREKKNKHTKKKGAASDGSLWQGYLIRLSFLYLDSCFPSTTSTERNYSRALLLSPHLQPHLPVTK